MAERIVIKENIRLQLFEYISDYAQKILLAVDKWTYNHIQDYIEYLTRQSNKKFVISLVEDFSLDEAIKLNRLISENDFAVNDLIVAIGDENCQKLISFCASNYYSLDYIYLPTTLPSMITKSQTSCIKVDDVDTFFIAHFPRYTLVDSSFLAYQTDESLQEGIASIIRYAAVFDSSLFALLDNFSKNIDNIIEKCIGLCNIIQNSDNELQHMSTFGNIVFDNLNKNYHSKGQLLAMGMYFETMYLCNQNLIDSADLQVLEHYFKKFGLMCNIKLTAIDVENMLFAKRQVGKNLFLAAFSSLGKAKIYEFD